MGAKGTLWIVGIAEGIGLAVAETFAQAGFDIASMARTSRVADQARQLVSWHGRRYDHYEADCRSTEAVQSVVDGRANGFDVAIVLAHSFLRGPFLKTSSADFCDLMATHCLLAANVARAVLPTMQAQGQGTLIFLGATASVRGGASFSALAASKFAVRGLAQSLAREFGPQGIHVAHRRAVSAKDRPTC